MAMRLDTQWGANKYVTPEILRAKGIGSGYFENPYDRRNYSRIGGWNMHRDPTAAMTDYHLESYQPWTEWGGQAKYDELVKNYQTTVGEIAKIPQIGTEDDLTRLTELDKQARDYRIQAERMHGQGRAIQDDYIKKWLQAYDIRYNPDAAVGGGRYQWDRETERGRNMYDRSVNKDSPYVRKHWSAYDGRDQGFQPDNKYRTLKQHSWDDAPLDALRKFKLAPPIPTPPKNPATEQTTTTTPQGTTTVKPMAEADWFSGAPVGAQGAATQRGLTGSRKTGSKYGKSFKRGENSLTTSSLNI